MNWHPHLHLVVTDGAFRPDGTFLHLGFHALDVLTEAFRRAVLREFVRRELLAAYDARSMLAWSHSGFHVHHAGRLEADDTHGLLQLAHYAARAPLALERLQYLPQHNAVRLLPTNATGPPPAPTTSRRSSSWPACTSPMPTRCSSATTAPTRCAGALAGAAPAS